LNEKIKNTDKRGETYERRVVDDGEVKPTWGKRSARGWKNGDGQNSTIRKL